MTRKRWYDLVNMPLVWVPLWLRAARIARLRAGRRDADHVEWASQLVKQMRRA